MKRILLVLTLLVSLVAVQAAPVGVEDARVLGQKYVNAHFDVAAQGELTLVYSQSLDRKSVV